MALNPPSACAPGTPSSTAPTASGHRAPHRTLHTRSGSACVTRQDTARPPGEVEQAAVAEGLGVVLHAKTRPCSCIDLRPGRWGRPWRRRRGIGRVSWAFRPSSSPKSGTISGDGRGRGQAPAGGWSMVSRSMEMSALGAAERWPNMVLYSWKSNPALGGHVTHVD